MWNDMWLEKRIPWDAGGSPPILLELIEKGELPKGKRALVPGCGSGYDVFSLAKAGWEARGLDLATASSEQFHRLRKENGLTLEQADVIHHDFFTFSPSEPFDLIWDYTFFCAISPDTREQWAAQMNRLLAPDGELITLIYPVDIDNPTPSTTEDKGPPFRLHPEVAKTLLKPYFELCSLVPVERSHPGREGKEWLARWKHLSTT